MCSEPVTFGGGMTMVNGSASLRSGRNSPCPSQWAYQRASIGPGSKVFGSSVMGWRLAGVARRFNLQRPARDPRNLPLHMFVDDPGKMLLKPVLEHRPEHFADHLFERV